MEIRRLLLNERKLENSGHINESEIAQIWATGWLSLPASYKADYEKRTSSSDVEQTPVPPRSRPEGLLADDNLPPWRRDRKPEEGKDRAIEENQNAKNRTQIHDWYESR